MRFERKVEQLRIEKHDGRETDAFLKDVVLMAEGEPLEYLMGEVLFCDAVVDVSLRPMIPRSETEHWVKVAIADALEASEKAKSFRSLDLFSGSGCIGLAFLKNVEGSHVDFIELNASLKKQIEISVIKNVVDASRVNVITGDGWTGATGLYDVITAVPPYVPPEMKEEVMQELHKEDASYFFDKEDGYFYHKLILSCAKEFLKEGGLLYIEFDIAQKEKIEQIAIENGFTDYHFLLDPYHHDYVIVCRK